MLLGPYSPFTAWYEIEKSWIFPANQRIIPRKGGGTVETKREPLDMRPIKNGWAAFGDGWAVHGKTEEEAVRLYHEAVERHREMDARAVEANSPREAASH